jgi:hypothetical protein
MAVLLVVYQLFLGREKMHRFSRYYLLAAFMFSLVAPFITFETEQVVIPTLPTIVADGAMVAKFDATPTLSASVPVEVEQPNGLDWQILLWGIYLTVSVAFLVRFVLNLTCIIRRARVGDRRPLAEATLVLVDEPTSPFSFLRFIFVSAKDYQQGAIGPELLTHELTHVRQRHTLDVLLVELLQVVLWFNPLVYLYKRAIRANHEFLADEHVIEHHQNVKHYQHLLLDTIFRKNTPSLVSNIGFSLTKKRLIMMTKKTSKRKLLALKLAVVPLVALAVFVFCVRNAEPVLAQNKKVTEVNLLKDATHTNQKDGPKMKVKVSDLVYENGRILTPIVDGKRGFLVYKDLPPVAQRGFRKQLTPIKKVVPTAVQLANWRNTSKYDLWIDEVQQADNSILKKLKPSDLCIKWKACRYLNADIGKYKDKQFEVHLMTNAYYEKDCRDKEHNLKELLK